ncbi:LLM class flavin-dependent oxidoreductase [Natronorubrum sp. FCH18a]|uniref:LLM class flavin-dependent oxidoreductase n=1 Tax=Natronorubrum sp. FCH18a TaxID=3447018 RepID=UPI003F51A7FF
MKFGLYINCQTTTAQSPDAFVDDLIEQTIAAREAEFDMITTGQHYLANYVQIQQQPLLARLSAEAGSMKLGPGVVLLPLHQPVDIAEQLTTLDYLSEGVIAGVGIGYRDVEFESFGIPKSERVGRFEEGVELMKRLWSEEDVVYEGEYYSVDGVTINPRPKEQPPVWIAANARAAVRRAAAIGDAWFVNPHSTITEIRDLKEEYDEVRLERGEDTKVPIIRETFVADTREKAVNTAREYLFSKYQRYIEWGQDEAMEDEQDLHKPFEELAEDRFLLGTPEEVCAEIERYEEELDAEYMIPRLHWPGMDNEVAIECIERIGDDVIPNV